MKKILKMDDVVILIRSIFEDRETFYPHVFLE